LSQLPQILSLETSGRLGSIALSRGPKIIAEVPFSAPMRHSAELFETSQTLFSRYNIKPDHIEQIHISSGPGSFTGIRIAVTMAKAISFANHAKIVAVNTLDVIAENATEFVNNRNVKIDKLGVVLDAKRGQFFFALYEFQDNSWRKMANDCLLDAASILGLLHDRPAWLLGEGLVHYEKLFAAPGISIVDKEFWNARAAAVLKLGVQKAARGEFSDPLTLTPHYLRGPDAVAKPNLPPIRDL
jgi:tRNA threonylcarbamoyladenosine biosynthesis protein TsaB